MKSNACLAVAVALLLAFANGICFGAEAETAAAVFFPETLYEFSPVLEDATVVHDFVVQNRGNATLQVQRVKTG